MSNRTFLTWFAVGHLANDWPIAALWLIVPAAGLAMELSPAEVGLLFTIFSIGGALAYLRVVDNLGELNHRPRQILGKHAARLAVRSVL